MPINAQWRTDGESDTLLIVDEGNQVREAVQANPEVLSTFLTNVGDLAAWHGERSVPDDKRDPGAWGLLVIARGLSGEVLTMDPELYWDGIYSWFRSRGVDYDGARRFAE
jgi:hypothetical protein